MLGGNTGYSIGIVLQYQLKSQDYSLILWPMLCFWHRMFFFSTEHLLCTLGECDHGLNEKILMVSLVHLW